MYGFKVFSVNVAFFLLILIARRALTDPLTVVQLAAVATDETIVLVVLDGLLLFSFAAVCQNSEGFNQARAIFSMKA